MGIRASTACVAGRARAMGQLGFCASASTGLGATGEGMAAAIKDMDGPTVVAAVWASVVTPLAAALVKACVTVCVPAGA